MENTFIKLERKSIEDQTQDVNGGIGNTVKSPETSIFGTSLGFKFQGAIHEINNPMNFQGGINTVNIITPSTSTLYLDSIEFNAQEYIPSFFGREEFTKRLYEYLCHAGTDRNEERCIQSKAIVICRQEGVGKTQVTRKYIQRYKQLYNHVFWFNAETTVQQVITFVRNQREVCEALHKIVYTLQNFSDNFSYKKKQIMQTKRYEYPDLNTLYDMTFEQVGSKGNVKLALRCLDVLAILNPDYIPTDLIVAIFRHKDTLDKALNLLQNYNLVTRRVGDNQMHRMIQAAKIESSRVSCTHLPGVKHNIDQIADSAKEFIQSVTTKQKNLNDILPKVVRIHDQGKQICAKGFVKVQTILADKLLDVGRNKTAIKIHRNVVQSSQQICGLNHLKTITTNLTQHIVLQRTNQKSTIQQQQRRSKKAN